MSKIAQRWTEVREDIKQAKIYLMKAIRLIWGADRSTTVLIGALTVVSSLLPVSQAYIAQRLIDSVLTSIQKKISASEGLKLALPFLLIEFSLLLISLLITQFRRWADEVLDHRLSHFIKTQIVKKALNLEIHHFENSEFYDKMQNARRQSEYRAVAIMNAGFLLVQNLITLTTFATLVIVFNPWIALILFGATVPAFIAQTHFSRLNFRLQTWKAPETRRMMYYEHLLTVDNSAKEIRLFELGPPLLDRFDSLFWNVFKADQALALKRSWISVLWGALATLSFYICYAWVVMSAILRVITLGKMTFYLTAFRQLQGTFSGLFDNINKLFENGLFMKNLFEFLELPEMETVAQRLSSEHVPDGIVLRNVSFQYAGQEQWALKNINLHIQPGQMIAFVGENGSGKTTLMKLLARLYEPTTGEIFINGRRLDEIPRDELYKKVGVIFQDFVRYQLTIRENVGFGSYASMDQSQRLERASQLGGASDLVENFKDGWETVLGGWFQKGRELSGGQWQKIALSRAFMRDSEILILDEPTSALDALKEHEVFQHFKEVTTGRISLLISHRFSTVRMADLIIVLKNGEILEQGSHEELLSQQGTYAGLFELQAKGYR